MNDKLTNMKLLKKKSILYIEDENNIRNILTSTLQLMCREVFPFSCAINALNAFPKIKPDIILSDVSLGEMSGIEFIKEIRLFDSKIPIIILSAHTDTSFLLEASKLKLVEYLTKPTTYKELENSLLLAVKEIQSNVMRFHYLNDVTKYDTLHKILYHNDSIKKLSTSETNLLELFIKNKDRTIHTEEIKNCIWDDSYEATDTALKSLLHKLRQKIGKDSIKNVSGIGYYLNIVL
jgi:two-component system response regulator VanR